MAGTLEPIDTNQCQAEKKGGSFMSFGIPQPVRCQKKPVWIGIDVRNSSFYGAMSLCDDCKKVCEVQMPSVSFQELKA